MHTLNPRRAPLRSSLTLALLAVIHTAAAQDTTPPAEPAAEGNAEARAESEDRAESEATHDRHCLRDTGTRIQRRDRAGCNHAIGESYTGEELRRTGATTTAEALRLLSPRFGG